jgi:hypothetical protein
VVGARVVASPAEVLKALGEPRRAAVQVLHRTAEITADDPGGRIEAAGARALSEREATPLGPEIIPSVINPIKRLTGAIHVYGGDFFAVPHSEWDPNTSSKGPTMSRRCWRYSRNPTVYTHQRDE